MLSLSALLSLTLALVCAEPSLKKVRLEDLKIDPPKATYDPSLETTEVTSKTLEETMHEGQVRGLGVSLTDKGEVKPLVIPAHIHDHHLRTRQRSDAITLPGGVVTEGELRSDFAESMVQQQLRR